MTPGRQLSQRFSTWVIGLSLLALAAVLRNQPFTYVGDNRFEQYWNPGRRITRTFTIWDGSRGLGWVREEFWPGATIPIGLFRLLGASAGLAEHLWHATLLATAALGCVALLRCYRPVLGCEHLVAALVYAFGPFSATFLLPSNLYFHHALTPWLLVLVHRGLHSESRWRSASAFALVVFLAGNLDTPGLIFAGAPMALLVVHEVWIEQRIAWRWALGWFGRAGLLSAAVSAAALAKTVIGADALTQRLESTETPAVVALASSWSESWRGLGFWVSYLREGGHPIRSTGAPYMTGVASVLLTFAPALLAVGAIWWARRDRARLLFASMAVAGVFLMVGAHPAEEPPLWGRGWLWTLNSFSSASVVRATYKAGITATLGLALLVGIGVVALAGRARTVVGRRVVSGGVAVVLLAGATPFWRGELYEPTNQLDAVADHWTEAMAWLDGQGGDGQTLIVPGATRAAYYWGWAGDDIHDALMDRAHLTDSAITVSPPLVQDLLEALDEAAADPAYVAGSLAPVLRRLGIEHLVVRNDLDWRRMGVARPEWFDRLRADPALDLVATFGAESPGARRPAVEIFAVGSGTTRSRAIPNGPWIVHSGSGAGWVPMAAAGVLDTTAPIVPSAMLDRAELASTLAQGAQLVITDTNRRRAAAVFTYSEERSRLLAEGEQIERPAVDLYTRPGSQTVASFPDAVAVDDPGLFRSLSGFRPQYRPAQAVDGDLTTGWVVPPVPDPRTRSLHIRLKAAKVLDALSIVAFDPKDPRRSADPESSFTGVARIGRFSVELSDGTTVHGNLLPGRTRIELPARPTTSMEIHILDTSDDADVGIAEVTTEPTLDLVEHVRMPDDVFRAAEADSALQTAVTTAPTTYILTRAPGPRTIGSSVIEVQLRRELRTLGTRAFSVTGSVLRSAVDGIPPAGDACVDIGLAVDGERVSVRLGEGDPSVPFEACAAVTLRSGWHAVTGEHAVLDRVVLRTGEPPARAAVEPSVRVVATRTAGWTLSVTAPDGAIVLPGVGYDPRWRASADGVDLGPPIPVDGQVGWVLPPSAETVTVVAHFGPAGLFRVSLAITFGSLLLCLAIALRRPRRR